MFKIYQQDCKTRKLRIGRPTLYQESTPWILNFPTKDHWRFPSKLEYLEKGLEYVTANYKKHGRESIAFPKLGVQNGKLSWDDVGPLMAKYLGQLDIDVYIYIAEGDREYQYDVQTESNFQEKIWKQFNELAYSPASLCQAIQKLNQRDAKKVAERRKSMEFTSLADIKSIEGLAKTSLKRIKGYIDCQRHTIAELLDISSENYHQPQDTGRSSGLRKRSRKKWNADTEVTAEPLFPVSEPIAN